MAIFQVSTTGGLIAALEAAQGRDEIQIASGNYGDVTLSKFAFSSEITITSADPDNPAVFSSLNVSAVSNVVFDGLAFDFIPDADTVEWDAALRVVNSSQITIRNSVFEGGVSVAGIPADSAPGEQGGAGILGEPIGRGMSFAWSSGIVIENNDVSSFTKGIVLGDVDQLTIRQNEIHDLRSSPITGTVGSDVLVEENYFHSFQPWNLGGKGDHGDYVHLWTVSGQENPTSNVVIKSNVFSEGSGESLLGIYLEDNFDVGFTDVTIEGNVIQLGDSQAVRLENVNGGDVVNNTLLQSSGGANNAPGIGLHNSSGINVSENVMSRDVIGVAVEDMAALNISLSDNVVVQYDDPEGPNFFGDLFVNSEIPGAVLMNIRAIPGSAADGVGSPLTQLDEIPSVVTPGFQISSSDGTGGQGVVLDATPTYGPAGQVLAQDATFVWDFGDGTTGAGRIVEHNYNTPGNYAVTLSVVLDGQHATTATTANAEVGITGDDIIAFNGNDGAFYLQGYGDDAAIDNTDAASVATAQGMALDLGGTGTRVAIAKEDMSRFFGSDTFDMSMTLQADQPGVSSGEVARIHGSIIVSVLADGDLNVRLFPDTGENIELKSSGVSLNDGAQHDISIQLDGASDSLQIVIDGVVAGSQTVTGSMPTMQSWGLVFGEPWGGQNFDGKLSAFELDAPGTDYPGFEGVLESAPEDPNVPVGETPRGDNPGTGDAPDEGSLPRSGDPLLSDFVTDFAELRKGHLRDDANVATTVDGSTVYLDGEQDHVRLGKLAQFETSEQLSFSLTYSKDSPGADEQRLVWNNKNVGLSVEGDSLKIFVGQADVRFQKAISIDNLGLDDADVHKVGVMIDAASDRLQVVLDDVIVLDRQQGLDISFGDGIDKAWKVGGAGNEFLDGEIYDFRIDASADFLPEAALALDDAALMG